MLELDDRAEYSWLQAQASRNVEETDPDVLLWERWGRTRLYSGTQQVAVVTLYRGDKEVSNGTIPLPEWSLEIAACIL